MQQASHTRVIRVSRHSRAGLMPPKPALALAFLHSLKALYPRPIPRKRVSQRDGVESSRGARSQRQSLLLDISSGIDFVFSILSSKCRFSVALAGRSWDYRFFV